MSQKPIRTMKKSETILSKERLAEKSWGRRDGGFGKWQERMPHETPRGSRGLPGLPGLELDEGSEVRV